ncbi:HNH endonuclease [Thermosulfurimonas sp.]|uniref:HNH endonuclease n=1 Tax=Thermosulfurimonas sp. TaxID=2080236 RepID=UPI0025FEA9DF|nr:HNH endonuclease [Thermosulfurimonas sp.]
MKGEWLPQEEWIRREREKARQLRKTRWWRRKCAAGVCYYCGRKVPPHELTMDHRIPLSQGGRSEKSNLVPACKECNSRKKYLLPWEWEEYLARLRGK